MKPNVDDVSGAWMNDDKFSRDISEHDSHFSKSLSEAMQKQKCWLSALWSLSFACIMLLFFIFANARPAGNGMIIPPSVPGISLQPIAPQPIPNEVTPHAPTPSTSH